MIHVLGSAVRRSLLLLLLGLCPYAAPLNGRRGDASMVVAVVAMVAVLTTVGFAVWKRRRLATLGVFVTLLAAIAAEVVFRGANGPLARAVWFVAPLEWCTLAALVWPGVDGRPRRTQAVAVGGVLALGVLSVGSAWSRVHDRATMWRFAVAEDPGDEPAALAVAAAQRSTHRESEALATLRGCAAANPTACACAWGAGEQAITATRITDAVQVIDAHAHACQGADGYSGLQSDAWVRSGRTEDGMRLAERVLGTHPHDAHAMFAVAVAYYNLHHRDAVRAAERADAAGYGDDATMLVGINDLDAGDLVRAAESFQRVHTHDPRNPVPVYDLALVADRGGHYHDAREGYLAALALDPTSADARYNLALLTLRAGFLGEARHDLDELARAHPDDPRLSALRQRIAAEPSPAPRP